MAHRLAPPAERDLDDIWYHVAKESGSIEIANRLFGAGCRSFAVGEYVIVYGVDGEDVLILRVVHGRREIETLFSR